MKLKRLMALVMSIALTSASYPFVHAAAQASDQAALSISGTVERGDKSSVAAACVRLRKVDTNTIVARTVGDKTGAFSVPVSEPGMYVVEVVDCGTEGVLAVGDVLTLTQTPITTLVVLPTVASAFLSSTALLVLAAASAAGIGAAAVVQRDDAAGIMSPEQ